MATKGIISVVLICLSSEVFLINHVVAGELKPTRTSGFNEQWLDAVISIEARDEGEKIIPVGTGFLILTEGKHLLLVTAAHVLRDEKGRLKLGLRYRRTDLEGDQAVMEDDQLVHLGAGQWLFASLVDLACRFIGWPKSRVNPPAIPIHFGLKLEGVQTGAPLTVLGFPTELRSTTHKRPVARRGMAARVGAEGFLVEAFAFPGNSGGPVVYVPPIKVGGGLSSPLINEERLVGVISSYIPYQEVAVSPQTRRARIIFEENSGLSEVIPFDEVLKLLQRNDLRDQERRLR